MRTTKCNNSLAVIEKACGMGVGGYVCVRESGVWVWCVGGGGRGGVRSKAYELSEVRNMGGGNLSEFLRFRQRKQIRTKEKRSFKEPTPTFNKEIIIIIKERTHQIPCGKKYHGDVE
jgi:hypothetical protein